MSIRMFGIPESELAKALREVEDDGVDLDQAGGHDLPEGERAGHRCPPPAGVGGCGGGAACRPGGAPRQVHLHGNRGVDRGGRLPPPRGPHYRRRESESGGSACRPPHPPARVLEVVQRRHRRLFERVEEQSPRGRSGADRGSGRGLSRGRRGDGGRHARALRRGCGLRHHRRRWSRRRHGGQAGRLRLLLCQDAEGEALARDPILPGSRNDVRERSVVVALHLVRYLLEGREPPR